MQIYDTHPDQASAFAERIAAAVRASHASLLFADCNAVAPSTVQAIERLLTAVGVDVVDVGVITFFRTIFPAKTPQG